METVLWAGLESSPKAQALKTWCVVLCFWEVMEAGVYLCVCVCTCTRGDRPVSAVVHQVPLILYFATRSLMGLEFVSLVRLADGP